MQIFYSLLLTVITIYTVSSAFVEDTVLLGAEWEEYKTNHNKYYDSLLEEEYRYEQFKQSKLKVAKHNLLYAAGTVTYMMGLNSLSDLSPEELIQHYTMDNSTMPVNDLLDVQVRTYDVSLKPQAPDSIDWRSKGAISHVKNQGPCGSCWAFAAMGALEAHHFIKHHRLVTLSEQNIVDCSRQNYGCGGGWPLKALQYVQVNHGVDTENSYTYTARQGNCRFNRNTVGSTVSTVWMVNRNENDLKTVVGTSGPVSVIISVADSFFHYRGGVYYEPNCRTNSLHAVLIVGYGNDPQGPYWLVKNSWGPGWGEGGYVKIARNRNTCGIVDSGVFADA